MNETDQHRSFTNIHSCVSERVCVKNTRAFLKCAGKIYSLSYNATFKVQLEDLLTNSYQLSRRFYLLLSLRFYHLETQSTWSFTVCGAILLSHSGTSALYFFPIINITRFLIVPNNGTLPIIYLLILLGTPLLG